MQVDSDALQAALARAITDAVSPEMQKEIFQGAMSQYLFRTVDKSRGETSPITEAFKKALERATNEMAVACVNSPENKARIEAAVQGCLEEVLKDGTLQKQLAKRLVDNIGSRW